MTPEKKEELKKTLQNVGSVPVLPAIWAIAQVLQEVIDELP